MKAILKQVIYDQRQITYSATIPRVLPQHLTNAPEVMIISGVRRCGKSVLLHQIRQHQKEQDYFLNFDDDRLARFRVENFQDLYEVFIELFDEQKTFYFDEIQNIEGWELFVRRLHDKNCKVFITGSNANMLSRELGTHLTGRYLSHKLFPFSFHEYLQLTENGDAGKDLISTTGIAILTRLFNQYMEEGGFPQFVLTHNHEFFKSLYESILYKDVLVRNRLTNEKEMVELVYYLASNTATLSSYSSLARTIGVKHPLTVKNYLGFLENTYMLFQVPMFEYSVRKQMANARKTYFIDHALVQKIGFSFSGNSGRLLENLVFVELKRRGYEVFYHSGRGECDFLLRRDGRIVQAIQVCLTLTDSTQKREISGLMEAMELHSLRQGLLLTSHQEEQMVIKDKEIHVIPVWKWLLGMT
ncbi:MAG TPA: ATP-binding protein [Bacteroidales bacterium]|nr:ATP-binding protein [Bacteroidales bacterium]HRZ48704.1 ATP-binding protein [Bacteroidales bacterium]